MDITRENFDDATLTLLDEVAILLLASQTLRATGKAFEHTEDLAERRTFDTAAPVLRYLESTSQDLLRAAFAGRRKRGYMAAAARKKAGKALAKLLPNIEKLAKLEIAMYRDHPRDSAPRSTNIRDRVLSPLQERLPTWLQAQ